MRSLVSHCALSISDNLHMVADIVIPLLGSVGLPGGFGTLEEVMEMTTWSQIGVQKKPVVLLNVKDFYSPLKVFIEG